MVAIFNNIIYHNSSAQQQSLAIAFRPQFRFKEDTNIEGQKKQKLYGFWLYFHNRFVAALLRFIIIVWLAAERSVSLRGKLRDIIIHYRSGFPSALLLFLLLPCVYLYLEIDSPEKLIEFIWQWNHHSFIQINQHRWGTRMLIGGSNDSPNILSIYVFCFSLVALVQFHESASWRWGEDDDKK